MIRLITTVLFTLFIATGCAKSNIASDFDCPLINDVPACLDTYDVDVQGDVPKASSAVSSANGDPKSAITDNATRTALKEKVVEVTTDTTYEVKPLVKQPIRRFGTTERMWFSAWEDTTNDLYIDQQYIYWSEKGDWTVSGGREW
ncbi:TraV family lipoprotein [Vibrio mediterranei]|uniref:TraV family lipoprotein n=1 Tax=Vibrio mediterranei TaxID=689 RepID=UPI001EFDC085|nr:TraV family lipoprotein [Vibrio mediterranei]MCG9658648.1 TraV family lipoprotein [Vibrio mediterranei]